MAGLFSTISGHELNTISDVSVMNLYVGGTGPGNYSSIQGAVDDALDGATVIVYAGLYKENIWISSPIHIIGLEKEKTIISPSNSSEILVIDSVSYTIIENLTFTCNNEKQFDIIKMINCDHCTIYNINIMSETLQRSAINVNGFYNTIERVKTMGRYFFSGVELYHGGDNNVKNNSFESCSEGILIHRSHNNLISSNVIINNTNGIYIEEGNQNFINHNVLNGNNRGLFSSYSTGNLIEKNDFFDNDQHAKFIKLFRIGFLIPNNWRNNYWDNYKGFFTKPILGAIYIPNRHLFGWFFPWLEFDKFPSNEPLNA